MESRETKIEADLERAFGKAAEREAAASPSGIVAAEASAAIWLALDTFRRLVEGGAKPEAAGVEAMREFSRRMESLRLWACSGA